MNKTAVSSHHLQLGHMRCIDSLSSIQSHGLLARRRVRQWIMADSPGRIDPTSWGHTRNSATSGSWL